jgi:hypothetical protein
MSYGVYPKPGKSVKQALPVNHKPYKQSQKPEEVPSCNDEKWYELLLTLLFYSVYTYVKKQSYPGNNSHSRNCGIQIRLPIWHSTKPGDIHPVN